MLVVGKILKAHGVRGDVKAESYMDAPNLFSKLKTVYIDGKPIVVERARSSGGFALLKLVGVDTMNDAEALRNKELFAKKEDLPKPQEGRFYIDDLLGCSVTDGVAVIGVLDDIYQYGSADVYVVKSNGATIMFPLIDGVAENIDVKTKVITVNRAEFDKVAVYED